MSDRAPQRFKAAPGYMLEVLDDEILLYHPVSETMVYCNATAAFVWGLCDGVRTSDDIIQLLVTNYPEAATDIPRQVRATIAELCDHGVLACVDAAPPLTGQAVLPDRPDARSAHHTPAARDRTR